MMCFASRKGGAVYMHVAVNDRRAIWKFFRRPEFCRNPTLFHGSHMLILNVWQRIVLYTLILIYVVSRRRTSKIKSLIDAFKYDVSKATKVLVFGIGGATAVALLTMVMR
jgi:hypothetical protein